MSKSWVLQLNKSLFLTCVALLSTACANGNVMLIDDKLLVSHGVTQDDNYSFYEISVENNSTERICISLGQLPEENNFSSGIFRGFYKDGSNVRFGKTVLVSLASGKNPLSRESVALSPQEQFSMKYDLNRVFDIDAGRRAYIEYSLLYKLCKVDENWSISYFEDDLIVR